MPARPSSSISFHAIVPAAGRGRRMGGEGAPKQYLPLAGRTVLEWSLAPLLERAECAGLTVVLSADDAQWRSLVAAADPRITTTVGGAERADSVLAGLVALSERCEERDWVLVHDAARPCLPADDLDRLLQTLQHDDVGGLLAAPLVDTLKRADDEGRVCETVPRASLWRALTPQMFRYGLLRRAVESSRANEIAVTDEAQAIELLGLRPRLVAGNPDNFKITVPDDLSAAERLLRSRRKG